MVEHDGVVEWHRFTVGERVRINVSPECLGHQKINWPTGGPHVADGQTGTIIEPPGAYRPDQQDSPWREHPYLVRYDRPIPILGHANLFSNSSRYAANELEPIEAARAASGQGEGAT